MAKVKFAIVLILLLGLLGLINPITLAVAAPDEVKWSSVNIPTGIGSITDLAISPNYRRDNTLFMLTWGVEHNLWRSRTGGIRWESVCSSTLPDVDSIDKVKLSPQYGSGSQVVFIAGISNGNPAIWKSTDNGLNFSPPRVTRDPATDVPFDIKTWAVVNDNTLFVGSFDDINNQGLVYRTTNSGSSYSTKAIAGDQSINSIALSPDYERDETILVGNTNGWVYWSNDNGVSFEPLPSDATAPPLTGNIAVAFDPQYSQNNTLYAASDTEVTTESKERIYRFVIGKSTDWESIDGTLPVTAATGSVINQLTVSADGTLYAANSMADGGMERCLNPTFPLAPTFETVTRGLDDGAKLTGLWLYGNRLWSIDMANTRLMTYMDGLAMSVTLTSPPNKAPGIGTIINYEITNVTLDWEVLAGATEYHWQLDYDRDFSSVPTGFEGDTGASSARLPPLEPATKYYWRVRAIEPVLSRWSPKWSFTTSIGAPTLYSPEAGASGVELKPLFQWSSTAWATSYELLVSTNDSFSSPLISMTGHKALPATAWQCDTQLDYNTTYYWKVRAIGSDSYSPWSDTGIFTTISEPTTPPLEPPLLQAPSPGAADVCLTPSFAWSGVDSATGYEFILAEDNNFTHPVISKLGKNALPAVAWLCDTQLDYNTTYYWKVRAIGSDSYSPWSDTGIFTTIPEPATPPLEPPLLQAPSPGAGDVCLTPSFAWSGAGWATGYEFILAEDNEFANEVIIKAGDNALPTTAWLCDTELDYNTTYYWKVRAVGSDSYSPWSDTGIFTTIPEPATPPEPPLLQAPSSGADDIWLTPSFAWRGVDSATGYEFILAEDDKFRRKLVNRTDTDALKTNAYLCEEELDYNTTYYWKVRAIGSDNYSPWSDTGIFTTISEPATPPEPPLLQAPSPGAGDVWLTPSFAWSGVDSAAGYEFILAEDNEFANEVIIKAGDNALPATAWLCNTELDYNTTYYWKVRAVGSNSYSPWSDTGIFTTISEPATPPEPPLLQAPSPGSADVCLTPSFAWSGAGWAAGYEFILAEDNEFANEVIIKAGDNALFATAWLCDTELDYNTTYYWKVRAVGSDSYSPWSDTGIFTTISEPATLGEIKWLLYLGGGLLLIMVAMLITLIIFGVKIVKPLFKHIDTIK